MIHNINMKNVKLYNIYLFISTFSRNIIDIYIPIFLYQKGINIRNILGIYIIIYLMGIFISYMSIKIGNFIGYKYILILSAILTSLCFYVLQTSNDIYLISLMISLSMFTYHPIRHIYGIKLFDSNIKVGKMLVLQYLASIVSSLFVIKKIKRIYLIIITLVSIIPSFFLEKEVPRKIKYNKSISKQKFYFYFFDQFKILFLLLEPLYLYIIKNQISYIGILNIIINISAIIYLYNISKYENINRWYQYLNIIFTIVLFIKINISNKVILIVLTFLEGLGIKINEYISTLNLYEIDMDNLEGHILISEIIFCKTRVLILLLFYLLKIKLRYIMYILLVGIFILSFQYKKDY